MCGITGKFSFDHARPIDPQVLEAMTAVVSHRGPDEDGFYVTLGLGLGHRRLSIIDLATGQQPLCNEDGTIWVVFNGEIYNFMDVRGELEQAGHRFRTRTDTEVIVHAYEEWGDESVHRFRGMFAFALWDAPRRRLLLVRDRLGVKPLYWAHVGNSVLFGSEIKAILASGLIDAEVNRRVLPELLSTRYVSGSETLFRGIHKLLPGQLLTFERGRIRIRQYWDVPVRGTERAARPELRPANADVVSEFRARLEESVR